MTKEIDFKVFDKVTGLITTGEDLMGLFIDLWRGLPVTVKPELQNDLVVATIMDRNDRFVLLEFTGAFDLDRNRIYVTDIVTTDNKYHGVVIFDTLELRYMVRYNVVENGKAVYQYADFEPQHKVVGNYHTQPHLLLPTELTEPTND